MDPFLNLETPYVRSCNLKPFLQDYTNPDDFLSRLVKSGKLIRLKNGFFLVAKKVERDPVPFEQVANLLYGPSYVSFEWALSFYGMIPEGVYVVTSVCVNRSRHFDTPVAAFDYIHLSHARYSIGITQGENSLGKFLIATKEKALADLVHYKSQNLEGKDLLDDLIDARRMDKDDLRSLDKAHLLEIANSYRSKTVRNLVNALGIL